MSSAVDSANLNSAKDLQDATNRISNSRQQRHLGIQKSIEKRNEVVKEIRDQRESRDAILIMQTNFMTQMMTYMHHQQSIMNLIMMKLLGNDNDELKRNITQLIMTNPLQTQQSQLQKSTQENNQHNEPSQPKDDNEDNLL